MPESKEQDWPAIAAGMRQCIKEGRHYQDDPAIMGMITGEKHIISEEGEGD